MKTFITLIIPFLFLTNLPFAASQEVKDINDFFNKANEFFDYYAEDGGIDYSSLKYNQTELKPLVDFIANQPLRKLDTYKRKAYLVNCYNLLVINSVVDHYPIKKVKDTNKFFKVNRHNVGGSMMTLDHLEYKVIFKEYKDVRLHFVLVCAAKGCPPIPSFAYLPSKLGEQLNQQCQATLDNPDFLYFEDNNQTVKLSPIFKWYKEEFSPSIVEFINAHRTESIFTTQEISYYEWNWTLNNWDAKRQARK